MFNGTAEVGAKVAVSLNGTQIGVVTADGTGHWSLDYTGTTLVDGNYSLSAVATDGAGNSSAPATQAITIDSVAPTAGITITSIAGDGIVSASEAAGTVSILGTVSGGAKAGDVVSTTINGHHYTTTVASDNSFAFTNISGADLTAAAGGPVTVSVTVTDIAGNTAAFSASKSYDDAPVAVADTAAAVEAGGVNNGTAGSNPTGNVLSNDTDVDAGDTKTVSSVSFGATSGTLGSGLAGAYGTLTLKADGSYSYAVDNSNASVQALNTGNSLTDIFTYTVKDAAGATSSTTLTVTINGANDAPVVTGGNASGTEDTALTFTWANFGVSDVDSNSASLGITVTALPADGSLQYSTDGTTWLAASSGQTFSKALIDAGHLRFVPDPNESGGSAYSASGVGNMKSDYATFGYQATDGNQSSAAGQMTIDISPVADTPIVSVSGTSVISGSTVVVTPPAGDGLTVRQYTNIPNISTAEVDTPAEVLNLLTLLNADTPVSTSISSAPQNYTPNGTDAPSGIPTDGAYRMTGLIYLEAGHTYTFSSYMDDTALLSVGGTAVLAKNFNSWGNISATNYTPTASGYYTLDWAVYNGDGVGAVLPSLSVDGGAAESLSTSNYLIYSSASELDTLGGVHGAYVSVSTSGGYYPVSNSGVENTTISLSPITVSTPDTDGSESIVGIVASGLLDGTVISDGSHSFAATSANGSVDISQWNLSSLKITPPKNFYGTYNLTLTATSEEMATGQTATGSTTLAINVAHVNQAPTPVADTAGVTEDSGTYSLSGNVLANDTDPDGDTLKVKLVGGLSTQVGSDVAGSYGTFHINANGSYTYVMDNTNARVNALNSGDRLTDTINYTAVDPSGLTSTTTLTITINGTTDSYSASNTINGTSGNDTLTGTGSADYISGAAGNDYIEAGAGDDVIYGGDSSSTAFATLMGSTFVTTADAYMLNAITGALAVGVATYANKGYGDLINGGTGNDAIFGGSGSDLLYGAAGNDYLNGGAGSDVVRGGAGNDRIEGGAGNDIMIGDSGADVFAWSLGDGSSTLGATAAGTNSYGVGTNVLVAGTVDVVKDFSKTDGDSLDLRDLLVGENHLGVDAGNLSNYLHFETTAVNGTTSTVVHVSTAGGFANGTYDSTQENQTIVLTGVNLLVNSSGTSLLNDNAVIQDLLNNKRLIVD